MELEIRNLKSFEKLFAVLVRRARRLGIEEPTYSVLREEPRLVDVLEYSEEVSGYRKTGETTIIVSLIKVEGTHPITASGWTFGAAVEHTSKGNILFPLPGLTVPEEMRHLGCVCQHCNTSRNRLGLYLVYKESTKEWKQVGRSCLRSFVGGASADALAHRFEFFGSLVIDLRNYCEAERRSEGGTDAISLESVVASSLAISDVKGWVSNSKAAELGTLSTASYVREARRGKTPEGCEIEDSHRERAERIIHEIAEIGESEIERSGFTANMIHNCQILARTGYCSAKSLGLACAMPAIIKGFQAALKRAESKEFDRVNSKHVGEVTKRLTFTATVLRLINWEGQYGTQYITILKDVDGNVLKATKIDADEGDLITFKATIKKHSEWDGVKQTELLRAKLITNHTRQQEEPQP